ncbi:hypothetical protein PVAP13_7KG120321 [Panicum virgatum]|uniref:Uncharacterized protein n=1 Tax=Panicum virgatum TaxID=38727 RepID=A0A8T0QF04_PANVG|nr:hypothetical protein PVAP13_7KG120321 [Panicum virgatum]
MQHQPAHPRLHPPSPPHACSQSPALRRPHPSRSADPSVRPWRPRAGGWGGGGGVGGGVRRRRVARRGGPARLASHPARRRPPTARRQARAGGGRLECSEAAVGPGVGAAEGVRPAANPLRVALERRTRTRCILAPTRLPSSSPRSSRPPLTANVTPSDYRTSRQCPRPPQIAPPPPPAAQHCPHPKCHRRATVLPRSTLPQAVPP